MRRPSDTRTAVTLADRVAAARRGVFVGREAEIAHFRRMLDGTGAPPLWFLVGPGGIGKSTLLQLCREIAGEQGHACLHLDARQVPANPPAAGAALERAAGGMLLDEFCRGSGRPVLMIDSFEYWHELQAWFRDEVLQRLPGEPCVVIAGRHGPGTDWYADPGWRALMHISRLGALAAADCDRYLRRRGVPEARARELTAFSRGHALALAMAADAVLSGQSVHMVEEEGGHPVYQALLESFTREARDARQRQALDACAVARELNEDLLAAMLGLDDARDLFDWLAGLSFIERGDTGLFPHDIVRGVLMREMPGRFPGRYEKMARAAVNWVVDRIQEAVDLDNAQAAGLAADAMYALRALPVVEHFLNPAGTRALYLDAVRDADWPVLRAMTERHEGAASREWLDFWGRRYPENVTVVRHTSGEPRGYYLRLDMEALDADDRDADPLTRCLWHAIETDFAPRPGDHMPFIRHWVSGDYAHSESPEKTQILMGINTYNMTVPNLRLTAQVYGTSDPNWPAQARALGIDMLSGSDTVVGDKTWRIYYNDWLREPPARYYRLFADRCIQFERAMTGRTQAVQAYRSLSREEFEAAAVRAIKHWHNDARLESNPLAGSALVVRGTAREREDGVRALRQAIEEAACSLADAGPAGEHAYRVLAAAYLAPVGGQKAAATTLNMGYSTFRRHLADARHRLVDALWRREQACR
ncbi:hypothetical protein PC39_04812 [Salinisphaera sp. PC39]|uniref:ATP-binding protein n=1 Tax=Salinisphaera sp. PC39 TaxID=1304156 RepID=UPI0033402E6F